MRRQCLLIPALAKGGFTNEARQALHKLALGHLGCGDVKKYIAASERSKLRDEVIENGAIGASASSPSERPS